MQNQYIQHGSANPSVDIKFVVPSTGLSANGLTHTTPGLTIAYSRPGAANVNITLASQTVTGAWTAGGFVLRADGVYRLDLPAAAALAGVIRLTLLAPALPADLAFVSTVIALGPDDMSLAAPTTSGIESALADNISAVPDAVWAVSTRTLTSAGAGGATAAEVWAHSDRQLTAVSSTIRESFADTLLGRAVQGGVNGGRTVSRAFQKMVNRWLRSGTGNTTLSNYGVDDATVLGTETLTVDSNGTVIGSDPS